MGLNKISKMAGQGRDGMDEEDSSCMVDMVADVSIDSSSSAPLILQENLLEQVHFFTNVNLKPQEKPKYSKRILGASFLIVIITVFFIVQMLIWLNPRASSDATPSINSPVLTTIDLKPVSIYLPTSISYTVSNIPSTRSINYTVSNIPSTPSFNYTVSNIPSTPAFNYTVSNTPTASSVDTSEGEEYCSTQKCRMAKNSIMGAIDVTADPCSNFYQYACGDWIKQYSDSGDSHFQILSKKNLHILRTALESSPPQHSYAERKAHSFYKSCMNKKTTEDLDAEPILHLLEKIGGWNMSGRFDIEKWDFQHTLQLLYNLPTAGKLFSWTVEVDMKNSSRNIIELDQGIVGFDKSLNFLKKLGLLLGNEILSTNKQISDVFTLERRLYQITSDQDRHLAYNKMTISNLTKLAPAIDWLQYFNFAFKSVNRIILPSDEVNVKIPSFMGEMSELVEEYLSTTEGRTILSNFMGLSVVQESLNCFSVDPKSFLSINPIIARELLLENNPENWKSCLLLTDEKLRFALGATFVRKILQEDTKPKVQQLFNEIREAFLQNLSLLKWLDDDTKALVKEKIDATTILVGYPDFILESSKLDKYYEKLVISPNDYFGNTLRIKKFLVLKNLEKLDEWGGSNNWDVTPFDANAYYTQIKNYIDIPAGILQDPFYDPEYPKFLNFGRIGYLMGHELTHALDNEGCLYDQLGNLHSWWKNSTIIEFEKQAQCFIDQYSTYMVNGQYVQGKETLAENIADNGGLRAAFRAYENWINNHGKEPSLPSTPLSHKQLFFVSFAQTWCTPKVFNIFLNGHSPNKIRVLGTLSNSEDFLREFDCPITNSIDSKKCKLW